MFSEKRQSRKYFPKNGTILAKTLALLFNPIANATSSSRFVNFFNRIVDLIKEVFCSSSRKDDVLTKMLYCYLGLLVTGEFEKWTGAEFSDICCAGGCCWWCTVGWLIIAAGLFIAPEINNSRQIQKQNFNQKYLMRSECNHTQQITVLFLEISKSRIWSSEFEICCFSFFTCANKVTRIKLRDIIPSTRILIGSWKNK